MRYRQFAEAQQQKDPNKLLAIKLWSDGTVPLRKLVAAGRFNPQDPSSTEKIANIWYETLHDSFSITDALNLARQPEYKGAVAWLTQQYIRGGQNFEDCVSQTADNIAMWARLKHQPNISQLIRRPYPTDINKFETIVDLNTFMNSSEVQELTKELKNRAKIERLKRNLREIVLINNDRFKVSIPLNYGACYLFNNEVGITARYCTGSSSGQYWFENYAKQGIIIEILDKQNANSVNGKWQIHSTTKQFQNAYQNSTVYIDTPDGTRAISSRQFFNMYYSNLMNEIFAAMIKAREKIEHATGHSVDTEIVRIKDELNIAPNT